MLLAIDTATRWAGLALHDGSKVVAELGWECRNTHTIELAPTVDEMLKRAGVDAAALSGIGVAIGPGSYTSLRVGLALAKGLALANQIPIVGVPTLDSLAASFGPSERQLLLAAAAGRSRVCAAVYQWQNQQWQSANGPTIETWETLLADLGDQATLFAGEIAPAAVKKIRAASKHHRLARPATSVRRASYLAEIALRRLKKDQVDDARVLSPLYLRDPAGN
jgi:tRNA threonylcarbamoyladenosine biosynthesis protein TsaB